MSDYIKVTESYPSFKENLQFSEDIIIVSRNYKGSSFPFTYQIGVYAQWTKDQDPDFFTVEHGDYVPVRDVVAWKVVDPFTE